MLCLNTIRYQAKKRRFTEVVENGGISDVKQSIINGTGQSALPTLVGRKSVVWMVDVPDILKGEAS